MENAVKRIGVLTSGGDAPGMNACIRAVVRSSLARGIECVGIRRGYQGLISGDILEMDNASVSRIINRGGTILYSARCDEFRTKEGQEKAYATCKLLGLDGLVAIGGDGTFRGALELSRHGISVVGIPGTIDNDLAYTEITLGYDTAVNVCVDAVRAIRATSRSHDRPHVVEVMGRDCGDIALSTAVATGAEICVVPEVKWKVDQIAAQLNRQIAQGNTRATVVVAEGCWRSMAPFDVYKFLAPYGKEGYPGEPMDADRFTSILKRKCGNAEVRHTVIGYTQRGHAPTAKDSTFAFESGAMAVQLLHQQIGNQVIGVKNGRTFHMPIEKALAEKRRFNKKLFNLINSL